MKFRIGLFSSVLCLLPAFLLTGTDTRADTVTNVAIPYSSTGLYSGQWSNAVNGAAIASASTSGNTGTGITFADWSGQFNEITPSQTTAFSTGSIALGSTAIVNTLFNNFYGDSGLDAVVTFTNSLGQTAAYDLTGGVTIRDYNQNNYQNGLTGGTPGVVTAQNWWNSGGQRLDVQTFTLPVSWNGTDLTSMTVYNPTTPPDNPSPDDALSALQVDTNAGTTPPPAVPEPSSLMLFGTGILGACGVIRRRFAVR